MTPTHFALVFVLGQPIYVVGQAGRTVDATDRLDDAMVMEFGKDNPSMKVFWFNRLTPAPCMVQPLVKTADGYAVCGEAYTPAPFGSQGAAA